MCAWVTLLRTSGPTLFESAHNMLRTSFCTSIFSSTETESTASHKSGILVYHSTGIVSFDKNNQHKLLSATSTLTVSWNTCACSWLYFKRCKHEGKATSNKNATSSLFKDTDSSTWLSFMAKYSHMVVNKSMVTSMAWRSNLAWIFSAESEPNAMSMFCGFSSSAGLGSGSFSFWLN
ncbi:hypothetical protein CLUG_02846 [Clavispora lusitaniae ATCC 42720]|uniref:Uncharacterized protein n=1 Tax=Clavispora lusitaniae (strain ATCC 42720) TaxID=306902 RepID=C4Y2T3_CLAL4|nr:uncharacterized protein CLUG_02846 [Clavispora lusitaniae ATCC 42720]EEQ38719.1 hypothetical protein CLUG_02846 [Clavispora lusitaniae ATCC 42720]